MNAPTRDVVATIDAFNRSIARGAMLNPVLPRPHCKQALILRLLYLASQAID